MSMRSYGVETRGMIMTVNEFGRLLNKNVDNLRKKGILDEDTIEELEEDEDIELTDILDWNDIIDLSYEIDYDMYIGEFEGYLEVEKTQDRVYYNGDDILVIELKKDDLYQKYTNRFEIIKELKDNLADFGIDVDDNYIEEHFGYVNGTYYA